MHISQELVLEFARLGVVYVHLIACCVAIGLVLTSDIAMIKQMFAARSDGGRADMDHLEELQNTVSWALVVLWVTGIALIAIDAAAKGPQLFENPKLQAKVLIVMLLTFNGVVLHHVALPWMRKAGSLLKLTPSQTMFATFAGAVSGVSWLYAAMLGVGRPLSWKYSLWQLMAAYPMLIIGGFAAMLMLTALARHRIRTFTRPSTMPTTFGALGLGIGMPA